MSARQWITIFRAKMTKQIRQLLKKKAEKYQLFKVSFKKGELPDFVELLHVVLRKCPEASRHRLDTSLRPTLVFIASRIIANLMGLVPGMIAGLPTTSMFFFQGLFYFRWRRELRRKIAEDAEEDQCFSDFLLYSC
eukprot:s2928_g7.t2